MVEHQIKDINQLIETPEKVNEKELTYFLDSQKNIPPLIFVFIYSQKFFITRKGWAMNNH